MDDIEKFVVKIREHYQKLRAPLAFVLIIVAFLAGQLQIPIAKEGALLAASLILVLMLFEIHKEIMVYSKKKTFSRFNDAALEFRKRVEENAKKKKEVVDIKWLGMAMDYGVPMLDDIIRCLKEESSVKKISLNICMLDPKWERLSEINETWPQKSISAITVLTSLYKSIEGNQHPEVKLTVHLYRHMPNWHGFMVDNRYLYLSECSWKGERLLGGENEYELVDRQENDASKKKIYKFLGWFNYCSQIPLLLSESQITKGSN